MRIWWVYRLYLNVTTPDSPEGANVFDIVKWYKRPKKILVGENSMFEKWTNGEGEAGYISRPVTIEKMNKLLFKET